jgi:hypothetical protein
VVICRTWKKRCFFTEGQSSCFILVQGSHNTTCFGLLGGGICQMWKKLHYFTESRSLCFIVGQGSCTSGDPNLVPIRLNSSS